MSFSAIVAPTTATNQNVTWTSFDEDVATVVDGVVTLLKAGETTITVTTEDGSFSASCDVTVTEIMTKTIVIDNALSLKVGGSETISATVTPAGASTTLTWKSSAPSVATVDATGKVSAVLKGTANITATATDGTNVVSEACVVTVTNIAVESVTGLASSGIIELGKNLELTASVTPTDATEKGINWKSSNTEVVTVSATGVVTTVGVGTATISATSVEDAFKKATCAIEVVDKSMLTSEIATAQALHGGAAEGTQVGQYQSGAKAELLAAITSASAVKDSKTATQVDIDAAVTALKSAVKAFEKKKISNETLLFNADLKQENMTYMATYWFSFNDGTASTDPAKCGSSVVTPLSSTESPFTMSTPGYDGKGKAAMMKYILEGKSALGYNPFVGMGLNFTEPAGKAFDMTGSTGISFRIKSDSRVYLEVEQSNILDAADYYIYLEAYPEWTLVEVSWDELEQYTWTGSPVDWDLTKLTKCQWKVQEPDGETGKVWIDEVKILGVALDLPEIVDYELLDTAVAVAEREVGKAVVGESDGNYPQTAVTALSNAIKAGKAVQGKATTQVQSDNAAATLTKAIADFKKLVIGVDRSSLEALIATANDYYNNSEEGYAVGKYLAGSRATLKEAIDAAQDVFGAASVSQTQVNGAITALQSAIDTFLDSEFDPSSINKTALQKAISDANTLVGSAVEGAGDGQYQVGSKSALNSAITAAQGINSNLSTSQEEVDATTTELRSAITAFQNAKVSVDKSKLTTAISLANTTFSGAVEGINKGNYPAGSKAVLSSAISAAQSVSTSAAASQTQVNEAITTLNKAVADFKALMITVDKSQLVYQIARANSSMAKADGNTGDGSGQYPASSVLIFSDAISYAQQINQNSTDQSTVDGEVLVLIAAISNFEKSVNPIVNEVDLTELVELMSVADSLLDNTRNPGSHLLEYIDLATRKSNAKTEYEKETHEQANINTQAELLAEAIEAFMAVFDSTPLAVDEVENVALSTYPNPCQNVITLSAGKEIKSIAVMNVAGSTEFVVKVADMQKTLDVTALKAGIYFAKVVYADGTVETIRFAKR